MKNKGNTDAGAGINPLLSLLIGQILQPTNPGGQTVPVQAGGNQNPQPWQQPVQPKLNMSPIIWNGSKLRPGIDFQGWLSSKNGTVTRYGTMEEAIAAGGDYYEPNFIQQPMAGGPQNPQEPFLPKKPITNPGGQVVPPQAGGIQNPQPWQNDRNSGIARSFQPPNPGGQTVPFQAGGDQNPQPWQHPMRPPKISYPYQPYSQDVARIPQQQLNNLQNGLFKGEVPNLTPANIKL